MILMEFMVVLGCLLLGTRFGGMGLGLISGIGLFLLTFVFGLAPGEPPVQVMLTILAVIGCAATLQTAGGLNLMMQVAERLLRRHPQYITILAPLTTWTLTFLCGTGHVVYTMFPIISDIALQKNIRPERPMAVASVASQMAICASPVSVAVVSMVSMVSILAAGHGIGEAYGLLDILMIAIPSSLTGVMMAALWSLRRGKDLDKDEEFQARIKDPEQHAFIYGGGETLLNTKFPKEAYWSTWIFFAAIAAVVLLGANEGLRPVFTIKDKTGPLSMNLVIQMMMLIAGAIILMRCKVKPGEIANGAVFKAGMVAIFSVFGVAWMSETFFQAHMPPAERNPVPRGTGPALDLRPGAVPHLQAGQQPGCRPDRHRPHGSGAGGGTQAADRLPAGQLRLLRAADLPERSGLHRFRPFRHHPHRQVHHQPQLHHSGADRGEQLLRPGLRTDQHTAVIPAAFITPLPHRPPTSGACSFLPLPIPVTISRHGFTCDPATG